MYKPAIWNAIQTIESEIYARTDRYELSYRTKRALNNKRTESVYRFRFDKEGDGFEFLEFESATWPTSFDPPLLDSITWFFPSGNYAEKSDGDNLHLDKFTNMGYSQFLTNCEEPVLYNYKGADEIYRVIWFPSLYYPVVFRFQKKGFNFILTTKVLQERYDEYPDELETKKSVSVSFFKWYKFEHKLAEADFWKLNLKDKTARPNDGSMWIVEGVKDGKYHMIERWSPEPDLRNACLYLLSISNLKIRKEDIY